MLKDAWTLAIETLSQIELQKLSERMALIRITKRLGISSPNTIRYAYGLVVETVRRRNLIDKFINSVLQPKTVGELNIGVVAFLRLYVYQTRVAKDWAEPDLEEAARIAKLGRAILGWKTLRVVETALGLLLARDVDSIVKKAADEEQVALRTFHPTWFVSYCFRLFGRQEAIDFLEGSIHPPPAFIRLNTLKASQDEILAKLGAEGVRLEKTEPLKHAYKVTHTEVPLTKTDSCDEGFFYIQDKASCFAAEVVDPKPEMAVLDVCAAPGAKTTYLAQLMQNQGTIYSLDYSPRRMRTWKQENNRMGIGIAEPIIADARTSAPLNIETDVAVLDPPCTSTGVFGRQPSAKWRLTAKSIERMADIQWQMINNVAEKVKHGGFLVYSTCSVTVEENELVIERFLKWHPEFSLTQINPKLGSPGLRGLTKCRRLYPHVHESNGFFIAKMVKE
ncbi:MAG TPA: RsmB/NOP family class I SAM-dependent RNA methyltransferase [Candidatus Bathyarchaeia archaeon]|nr:RsmB/NOP family class I SAM-dependent RNA methyltransferase [Candidatus Bathyarchaeia archaeon]